MSNETNSVAAPQELDAGELTQSERLEACRYGRRRLFCELTGKLLDLACLAAIAVWLAEPLDAWLSGPALLARHPSLRLIAMFLVLGAIDALASFPLSLYSGYVLEHRFGLSRLTLPRWAWRYLKRSLLAAGLGLALIEGLYAIIWTAGPLWWLVAAGAFFLASILISQLVPVLILPLFYSVERLDAPHLAQRMARLAEGTGLTVEGVYRLALSEATVKANAMLAGLGRTRRVLLGDTLLEHFSPDEIEVIFAHEIGHHVFRHIHKMIALGAVYSVCGFGICDRLLVVWMGRAAGASDYSRLSIASLPLLLLILTLFGTLVEPVQNSFSRRCERQCDRYALERTGLRGPYVSAFRKLARLNKEDPDPCWLEVLLFDSHPPISQRLALAEE